MLKTSLMALLIILIVTNARAGDGAGFKKHNVEISFSPGLSSHFVTHANRNATFKPMVDNLYQPYFGCNIGAAYIYRPIRYFGISTGLEAMLHGIKMGMVYENQYYNYYSPTIPIYFKGYEYNGFLSLPVLFRAYLPIKNIELELATGPDFLFSFVYIYNYTHTSADTNFIGGLHTTTYNNATQMRQAAWFGWVIQVAANIPIKNSMSVTIGPDLRFLTAYPLHPGPAYNQLPHDIDYFVGCKIGFRFGTDGKKAPAPAKEIDVN